MRVIRYIVLVALVIGTLFGCRSVYLSMGGPSTSVTQKESSRAEREDATQGESIWPSRWGVGRVVEGMDTGVIVELDYPITELAPARLSRFHQLRSGPTEYSDAEALAQKVGTQEPYKFRAEGPGSYLFVHRPPEGSQARSDDLKKHDPELAFKFISAQLSGHSAIGSHGVEEQIEIERTWFTYRTPRGDAESIGTALLMPGMLGTPKPIIDAMQNHFLSKGWAVLRMLSHPSRFTQRAQFALSPGTESEMAIKIASISDTRSAECGYAASAAMRFVHDRYPINASKPVVLIGMSGGAIVLPTVYAFDPELYSGAVIIAGGGNFVEINVRSKYTKWIDTFELDADPTDTKVQEPTKDQLDVLFEVYLEHSRLDSLHMAESMLELPVLMLHASQDKAVPASTGDALYEALGKPERWVFPVGHELIFLGLPLQTPKIETWLREHVIEAVD